VAESLHRHEQTPASSPWRTSDRVEAGFVSAELVEVNPVLDHQNVTARLGVELLTSLLGKKIL